MLWLLYTYTHVHRVPLSWADVSRGLDNVAMSQLCDQLFMDVDKLLTQALQKRGQAAAAAQHHILLHGDKQQQQQYRLNVHSKCITAGSSCYIPVLSTMVLCPQTMLVP